MNLAEKQAAMRERQRLQRQREEGLLLRGDLSLDELFDLVAEPMVAPSAREWEQMRLRLDDMRPAKKQEATGANQAAGSS